jgi:anti-sigma regulatory factor (Ser/Thr protein kinase)
LAELLGNLIRHAPGPAWVSLHWPADTVTLVVTALGPGFSLPGPGEGPDPLAEGGRGLLIIDAVVDKLSARARSGSGARVTASLPLLRPQTASLDLDLDLEPSRSPTAWFG